MAAETNLGHDVFIIRQRHRAFLKSKYYVYDEARRPLLYVERPTRPWGVRSAITIYADDSRKTPLLALQQKDRWEFLARDYTLVSLPEREVLARLTRPRMGSLLHSNWTIADVAGSPIAYANEDFAWGLRRLLSWVPLVDTLADVTAPADFNILLMSEGGVERYIGTFERKRRRLTDEYVLDLTGDPERRFDRRVAIALGILLDTAEGR